MPTENLNSKPRFQTAYAVAVLGAMLIVGGLVWLMIDYTRPPDLNAKRAAERARALAELQAQTKEALETYAWSDQPRGMVRLPIQRAMEMTVQAWRNPAEARSNLLARAEKATAKLPEKPSPYE